MEPLVLWWCLEGDDPLPFPAAAAAAAAATATVDKAVVPGKDKWAGTLSPMIRTHSEGKKPTSKPRFPLHHMLSSGAGMSITLIISPT